MLNKFNKKRFAGVILAGMIIVAGGATAFAANQTNNSQHFANHGQPPARIDFSQMSTLYKSTLDSLVTAGTITQAQEDAVLKTLPAQDGKGRPEGQRMNPMDSLVTAGTITQTQADAIREAMKSARDSASK